MTTITGVYHNGQLKLDKPLVTKKPLKITITFEEDSTKPLELSDFSFLESQEMLKNVNVSFADAVIDERRSAV